MITGYTPTEGYATAYDVHCQCPGCGKAFVVTGALTDAGAWRKDAFLRVLNRLYCDRCTELKRQEDEAIRLQEIEKAELWHEVVMGRAPMPGSDSEEETGIVEF